MRFPIPATILAAALVLGGAAACGPTATPSTAAVTTHEVTYEVRTSGVPAADLKIRFTGADGKATTEPTPPAAPMWTKRVTIPASVPTVIVTAAAAGAGSDFVLTCSVTVDGTPVASRTGPTFCSTDFDLANLAAARSPHSATPTTPGPSPTPTVAAADPPGCLYLTVQDFYGDILGLGGSQASVSTQSGTATACTYEVDADRTNPTFGQAYVTLTWAKGAKLDPNIRYQQVPVAGLGGVTGYWLAIYPHFTLSVQRPHGVATVDVVESPQFGTMDPQKIAVAAYQAAAAKLP